MTIASIVLILAYPRLCDSSVKPRLFTDELVF